MTTDPQALQFNGGPEMPASFQQDPRAGRTSRRDGGRAVLGLLVAIASLGGFAGLAGTAFAGAPPADVAPAEVLRKGQPKVFSARALVAEADAQLAAGHPGRAILAYERARLVAPRSSVVGAGLARARAAANLSGPESGPVGRVARLLNATEWGWIFLVGFGVFAAGLVASAWDLVRRRAFVALSLLGAGVAAVSLLAARQVAPPPMRAVVIAADAVAHIAPFAQAEQAFVAPEGAEVTVERTHGAYALIAGSDGRGWVPHDVVETIVPGPGPGS